MVSTEAETLSFGAKLAPLARILLFASTLEPISTELKLTAALALLAGAPAVEEAGGLVGAVIGGAMAVALGGGVDGTGEAGSPLLPQALSASTAASMAAIIRGWRVVFIGSLLLQDLDGIFNVWPGLIRSGSVSWSRLASKICFHAFALP